MGGRDPRERPADALRRRLAEARQDLAADLRLLVDGLIGTVDSAGLYLVDARRRHATAAALADRDPAVARDRRERMAGVRIPLTTPAVERLLAEDGLVVLDDTPDRIAALLGPDAAGEPPLRSVVRMPVVIDGETIGVLAVSRYAASPPMTDCDVEEVRQAAGRAAWLVGVARATARLERDALLLATVSDAIVTTDSAGRAVEWNAGAEQLYGISEADAVGTAIDTLVPTVYPDGGTEPSELLRSLSSIGQWSGRLHQTRPDGRSIYTECQAHTLAGDDDAEVVLVLRDVTALVHAELEQALRADVAGLIARGTDDGHRTVPRSVRQALALVVDEGAELAQLWLSDPDGRVSRCVASAHRDPGMAEALRAECEGREVAVVGDPTMDALARGDEVLLDEADLNRLAARLAVATNVGPGGTAGSQALAIPVEAAGRTLGVVVVGLGGDSDAVSPSALSSARQVAGMVARYLGVSVLVEQLDEQRRTLEDVSDAVIRLDADTVVRQWNGAAEDLYGIPRAEAIGVALDDLVETRFPDGTARDEMRARILGGEDFIGTTRQRCRDGTWLDVEVHASGVREPGTGRVVGVISVNRDVSARLRLEREAIERQRFVEAVVDSLPGSTCVVDRSGVIVAANRAFALPVPGPPGGSPIGIDYLSLVTAGMSTGRSSPEEIVRSVRAVLDGTRARARAEISVGSGAGQRWLTLEATPLSEPGGAVITHLDITARTLVERELERAATHDPLTGAANRDLLHRRIVEALTRARERGTSVGLLFVDLDRFKDINDSLGHAAGDEVLRATAERLRLSVRVGDTVARVSGDEFVVVMEDLLGPEAATHLADTLLTQLSDPVATDAGPAEVSASIGVVVAPGAGSPDAATAEDLLGTADAAMYDAKQAGRAQVRWSRTGTARRVADPLGRILRARLDFGTLRLAGQPVVHADGALAGEELLLRLDGRPDLDIALLLREAEREHLLPRLTETLLERACHEVATRHDLPPGAFVAVNLSHAELVDPRLISRVADALTTSGVDPGRLVLDVTERCLMESPDLATAVITDLTALGVRVALDDVGQGTSSLTALLTVPVSLIKLDCVALDGLGGPGGLHRVLAAMTALASTVGARAVAERVESDRVRDDAVTAGIDLLQGHALAPPRMLDG